jgi:hypothetical protein
MSQPRKLVTIDGGLVRLSDDDLHRRACKAIWESNHIVFESLPGLIAQIIENRTWRSFQHKDFASYALDATSNGLGINSNQRLWILRCSMDIQHYDKDVGRMAPGKHIKEWADVITKVEEMVRLEAAEAGKRIRDFTGNSLEAMVKDERLLDSRRITYLPSGQVGGGVDGTLIRLRRNKPDIFKRVVTGEISVVDARRSAGLAGKAPDFARAKSLVRNMTAKERREFIAWMRDEGFLD